MLVKEKVFQNDDGSIGYYNALYSSSNILETTYFVKTNKLYISFNRGGVYSFDNVRDELYADLRDSDSQGIFFAKNIKNHPELYPFRKEFTLYPSEVDGLKEIVDEIEYDEVKSDTSLGKLKFNESSNDIMFYIDNKEYIKINSDGFHWKGNLIENDREIYMNFKTWLDISSNK